MANLEGSSNVSKEIDKTKNNTFQETDITTDIYSSFPNNARVIRSSLTKLQPLTSQKNEEIAPSYNEAIDNKSRKAGLRFSVARIHKKLKRCTFTKRISVLAPVYLSAVLEYMTAEVLEKAGVVAKQNHHHEITPHHIQVAAKEDQEMEQLLEGVILSEGGVLQTEEQPKLPSKPEKKDKTKGKQVHKGGKRKATDPGILHIGCPTSRDHSHKNKHEKSKESVKNGGDGNNRCLDKRISSQSSKSKTKMSSFDGNGGDKSRYGGEEFESDDSSFKDHRGIGQETMARGKRQKAATKMKIVKSKSKLPVGQKKKKVQPKNDSRAARNVQDKLVGTKRKKAVDNKISPTKKRKLEHINKATAFDNDEKKITVKIREEEKQKECMEDAAPFEMIKSKENFRVYKQVYISVARLDKNILNETNISMFNSERKVIVAKGMNGDIGTDQLKDKPNNENLEKILELEKNIGKLKSEKVILEDDNRSKNAVLNSVIKEKEEYKEKFVNEVQKCNEIKVELERVKSSLTMLKSVKEVEARKNKIGELVTEKEALEAEMKNKDKTLKLVRNEASLKFQDASEKLTWVVELNQELKEEVEELQNSITSMKAKHKIDLDLLNNTIEELMSQAKTLTLSNNQMMGKVENLTKQLDLKDLKIQNLSKQLEEVNKQAESLAKLYEEKRNEVESLIEKNEEKDKEWDNIFKKSEEQMEELGLLLSQFKQKTYEVEIVFNQSQEKQKQLKRITRQNKEESQELEGSVSEMEKERDILNSQEERRTVDENTAEKAKALQDKEKSGNKSKEDSETNVRRRRLPTGCGLGVIQPEMQASKRFMLAPGNVREVPRKRIRGGKRKSLPAFKGQGNMRTTNGEELMASNAGHQRISRDNNISSLNEGGRSKTQTSNLKQEDIEVVDLSDEESSPDDGSRISPVWESTPAFAKLTTCDVTVSQIQKKPQQQEMPSGVKLPPHTPAFK